MSSRELTVNQLHSMFGGDGLTRSIVGQVLDSNKGDVEHTVDELLTIASDTTLQTNPRDRPSSSVPSHVSSPQAPSPQPPSSASTQTVQTIHEMFKGDMTESVITAVLNQQQGDIAEAVNVLLQMHHDDESLEAVSALPVAEREQVVRDMQREQEELNRERQAQLLREIEADQERIRELKKQMDDQQREHRLLLQKQQEVELARQATESSESDDASLPLPPPSSTSLPEPPPQKEAIAPAVDAAHHVIQHLEQTMLQIERDIKDKELMVSQIAHQHALCTLSIRRGLRSVIVSWSVDKNQVTQMTDWIGFYKQGQPDESYRQYIKTNGERQGYYQFTLPKTPGLYRFKYFTGGSYNAIATSDYIHVGPQLRCSASISDTVESLRSDLIVNVQLVSGDLSTSDWFGLYPLSERNNKQYIQSVYVPNAMSAATEPLEFSLKFKLPRAPGDYVIRFFPSRCRYTHVVQTNPVRVENVDSMNVSVERDSSGRVGNVTVTWKIESVEYTRGDYIALYRSGAANNAYIRYQYVSSTSGSHSFQDLREVGSYDCRYHSASQSKYIDCCRTDIFEIPNTDSVSARCEGGLVTVNYDIHSQPKTKWDWIGLFEQGNSNKHYISYKYVDLNSNGAVFEVPKKSGTYEVRYFSYNVGKYTDFRKSNVIVIA